MVRQLPVGGVQLRLVSVRMGDSRQQVVKDREAADAREELEHPYVTVERCAYSTLRGYRLVIWPRSPDRSRQRDPIGRSAHRGLGAWSCPTSRITRLLPQRTVPANKGIYLEKPSTGSQRPSRIYGGIPSRHPATAYRRRNRSP